MSCDEIIRVGLAQNCDRFPEQKIFMVKKCRLTIYKKNPSTKHVFMDKNSGLTDLCYHKNLTSRKNKMVT